MRRAGIIIGILILGAGFTLAWFALQPPSGQSTNVPGRNHDDVATFEDPELEDVERSNDSRPDAEDKPEPETTRTTTERETETGTTGEGGRNVEIETGTTQPGQTQPTDETANTRNPPDEGDEEQPTEQPSKTKPQSESEPKKFIRGFKRPPGQNLGNTRPRTRRIAKPAGVRELAEVTEELKQDRRGLYAEYWWLHEDEIDGGAVVPKGDPNHVRIDRQVWFPDEAAFDDLPFSPLSMAAAWTGFLVIEEPGDYWLFWGADNGGRVELDGETVLLQDGMVRYVEVSTVLTLEEGLHPIRIEFAQFDNGVSDWKKLAANFMYVPEGESKPIPVPPEMLMLPEALWSDEAPIISHLSREAGEIGDEVIIHGKNFEDPDTSNEETNFETSVYFAGQETDIVERTGEQLVVRVPLGADTGEVVVHRTLWKRTPSNHSDFDYYFDREKRIPSNGVPFEVTTTFGLLAEWHNLQGWGNFDFIAPGVRDPDVTRVEREFMFEFPGQLDLEFRDQPLACKWEGFIGVPEDKSGGDLVFMAGGKLRVTLAGKVVESEPTYYEDGDVDTLAFAMFALKDLHGAKHRLTIEIAAESEASLVVIDWRPTGLTPLPWSVGGVSLDSGVPSNWFYPLAVPPEPPNITHVTAVWEDGEQPSTPPYDPDPSRPSVAVGQEFNISLTWSIANEARHSPVEVSVDSIPIEVTEIGSSRHGGGEHKFLRAVMPDGVGEGKIEARQGNSTSEPYFVDITNRGLVTYLYDVPEGSGLNELPDLQSAHCFKIRKDRQIDYETTADFDLPFPAETFVIEWLGGLIIEEEGDYVFTCRSDDGMKLWLDDNVIIDANHRQAPAENSSEVVHLVPGIYRFRMQFFENNQHEVCVLEWRATSDDGGITQEIIPREVIPARAFSNDVHPPLPAKTSSGLRTDGSEP